MEDLWRIVSEVKENQIQDVEHTKGSGQKLKKNPSIIFTGTKTNVQLKARRTKVKITYISKQMLHASYRNHYGNDIV